MTCVRDVKKLCLLAIGRWFPLGTPVSSTRKLILSSSSFHRLDMTLADAEALNPNKLNQTEPVIYKRLPPLIATFKSVGYVASTGREEALRDYNRCSYTSLDFH